ncbi:MAG: hypothetical protein U9Q18_05680 [Caldisericota bacterium]|nr:hypothetical protein [Caldisericota bacterium]
MERFYSRKEMFTKITHRQREFLEVLSNLYKETDKPVSYKDVATKLNVTKWTAYDILQTLTKKGLLGVKYNLTPGPGRSEIKFIPKKVVLKRLGVEEDTNELLLIHDWIKERFKQYENESIVKSATIIARKLEREKNPLSTVLRVALLFALFAKEFRPDIEKIVNIEELLKCKMHHTVLLSFFGEIMFAFVKDERWAARNLSSLSRITVEKFNVIEKKFVESTPLITANEQKKVLVVLKEVL